MDEHDQLLIVIVFSIVGFISLLFLACLLIWLICRRRSRLTNHQFDSPRQRYQCSQNFPAAKRVNIHQRRKNKRRFNTNDSSISLSFNPPHLINQNVKHLDQLLVRDPLVTAPSRNPKDTTIAMNRCYTNPRTEPVYTSSSSLSTSMSDLAIALRSYPQSSTPQLNHLRFHFLNELNHALCSKQPSRSMNPLKYSQSCRQRNDPLPFDYYRTLTSSTITGISSSNETLFESLSNPTFNYSNATLMRKARLAQLRDDTAIYY